MSALRSAWHHIRRSPFQSFSAILIIWFCFFVSTFFFVISDGLSGVLSYFETKPEITIFLKDGLDKPTLEAAQNEIATIPDIREVRYVSKEKALEDFKNNNANEPAIIKSLEELGENPLLASLVVKAKSPDQYESVAAYLAEAPFKEDVSRVNYGKNKEIIEKLKALSLYKSQVSIKHNFIHNLVHVVYLAREYYYKKDLV